MDLVQSRLWFDPCRPTANAWPSGRPDASFVLGRCRSGCGAVDGQLDTIDDGGTHGGWIGTMNRTPLEMTKEARPENLRLFISFIDLACQSFGISPGIAADVKLAVEEVCSNIIEHGYRDRELGPIALSCERTDDSLKVTISDRGRAFDPADAEPADIEADWRERQIGGLGWHLVKRVTDELSYHRDADDTNRLVLHKRLDSDEAA